MLGMEIQTDRTTGQDIFNELCNVLRILDVDLKKVVSITTDGRPSIVVRNLGLTTRLKEQNPSILAIVSFTNLSYVRVWEMSTSNVWMK